MQQNNGVRSILPESEDQLQAKCFQWHWNTYPSQRGRLFHVNQKARNKIEGNHMKAMGVVPGVSDLIYLTPTGPVFIEIKTEIGTQSTAQKEFQAIVTGLGFTYHICRNFFEFHQIITPLCNST